MKPSEPPLAGSLNSLAVVGSGPSCVFLLKRLLTFPAARIPRSITIFEKSAKAGTGMPYRKETTDRHHLSNISSEEIPLLAESFADWLRRAGDAELEEWFIDRGSISDSAIYPRLALGAYFRSQYIGLVQQLEAAGVKIEERLNTAVADLSRSRTASGIDLTTCSGEELVFDSVVISTGHQWPKDERKDDGLFASPWPIWKILPQPGAYHNFAIGILGASLSAFDVVTTLAHHHGEFLQENGSLEFRLHRGAEQMRIVLHSADGSLPHLLFEQTKPIREIYRHATREALAELVDSEGFLPLARFFDRICRPILKDGFRRDGRQDMVALLESNNFTLSDLVEKLSLEHAYEDPFGGMAEELAEAERLSHQGRPTH